MIKKKKEINRLKRERSEKFQERDNRTNSTHQRLIEGSKNLTKWNHDKKLKMQSWLVESMAVSLNL
jgi:hypothetical protein